MTFFHVDTQSKHRAGWSPFLIGQESKIGKNLNPLYANWRNSVTRPGPGVTSPDISQSVAVMLRELAFENTRSRRFPTLPSRTTCIWLCDSEELAKYCLNRVPHNGGKRILELDLLDGSPHKAYEQHLTNRLENIAELEVRAEKYWSGEGSGPYEILLQGTFRVVRELHT